jgi:hypothetical protein
MKKSFHMNTVLGQQQKRLYYLGGHGINLAGMFAYADVWSQFMFVTGQT